MILKTLETSHYRIPLPTPMADAMHGTMTHFEVVMVRIETDDRLQGLGYTYTIGQGGAAIRSLVDRDLKPVLLGADTTSIEQLWETMWWRLHYVGRGGLAAFAISAVDIALWDLRGHREGVPLWRLLGGHSPMVRPYAGGIDLHLSRDELLQQTRTRMTRGFRAIKIKVGLPDLDEDAERVRAVREVIGPDVPLMVDANMRWDADTAIRAARRLREYDVYWLEEPTIPDDVKGHARISREGGVPIATGENLHTIHEFEHMIADGGISYPEPDVANIGGVTAWMRVARLAQANHLQVTSHGVHELHVHLLAAVPNASYLEVHGFGLERLMRSAPSLAAGLMAAPDGPGHGVEFDWQSLEKWRETTP